MALSKTKQKKSPAPRFLIRTLSLTPENTTTLARIAQDASDAIGWTVSGSAIVRALLRYADLQGEELVGEHLFPLVEQEIQGGTVWGKKK